MQKLSRTERYKDYRNKLNNDGEREIATKELKELQEKIIFNEKRFGNTSRTESDLNRGIKDASYESIADKYQLPRIDNSRSHLNDLDDIFNELNKYKKTSPNTENNINEDADDYIKKIKDIVNNANVRHAKPDNYDEQKRLQEKPSNAEEPKELFDFKNNIFNEDKNNIYEHTVESIDDIKDDVFTKTELPLETENTFNIEKQQIDKKIENFNNNIAEFDDNNEQKNISVKSQLENVQITKPVIEPVVPQHDHSKEFEEICENVNSLAEEIESSSSFGEDLLTTSVSNHIPMNSFEGIQQDIKKDIINSNNDFLNALQEEIEQHTSNEKSAKKVEKANITNGRKQIVKNNEDNKEEYDNTVSLQVGKLLGEINSSKADNISADDIIANNNIAKKSIDNKSGKTIAFEVNKSESIPDNTIVITHPSIEDSSIHTMSFKTEELDINNEDKGNVLLNLILSVLIIVAVVALLVIVYFFLITRGII